MAKLPRAAYVTYLSFDKENWTALGKDTDSLAYELNPDVETAKNVLGETIVNHSGFAPELAVDTYYAHTEDSIYEKILDMAMNRKFDEASTAAYLLECVLDESVEESKKKTLTGKAWMENVVVIPQSTGGELAGFGLPFNVNPNGGRVEGTVSVTDKVPTFTPGGTQTVAARTTAKKTESSLS
ncbi:MAG: hypothetical protein NC548_35545 [Lachnospiraceae bacterium]|nr:hypothetical protein [Lachnospiraceae bacterium]MCM1232715.1 hypothetical protein [Ruminococcus flavefaciens]